MPEEAIQVLCSMNTVKAAGIVKEMGRDTDAMELALTTLSGMNNELYHSVMAHLTRTGWF